MEENSFKKLPAYVGLLDIIRSVYNAIDTKGTIEPIEEVQKTYNGIGARFYKYSLIFSPNAWEPGVHDADITIFNTSLEEITNIRVRIETNLNEIYINGKWDMLEWIPVVKEALEGFFLDYTISAHIHPEIKCA